MKKKPPFVSMYRDRHRVVRWRFRKTGRPETQTREAFDTPGWWAWYFAALEGARPKVGKHRSEPGTFDRLIAAWYESAEFKLLKPSTRATYRGELERLRGKIGKKRVAHLQPNHIREMMDALGDTPAAANNRLRVLRLIMPWAVERKWCAVDPTVNIKRLRYKTEGWHTWTEEEIQKFEGYWVIGTKQRVAFDLLLYTGQRSGDVRMMGRQHLRGSSIRVKQEKTGAELWIPQHPALAVTLAATPSEHLAFLTTQFDRPYTAGGFGNFVRAAAAKAGLPTGCCAHGLRKAAARRLAEVGCSQHEIMSITGHKTLKEVERYTREADQRRLGEAAMAKLVGTDLEQKTSNPLNRADKTGGK